MDDLQIIELYFKRDEDAIKQTAIKYGRLCHTISSNILNNYEDVQECINDTYLAVWNKIPPEKPENLMAFVGRIARNISLKKLEFNTAQKRNPKMAVYEAELENIAADEHINDGISREEMTEVLNDFLKNEKQEARNVFIRRYWYFDSVSDIACRYSFSESKVKSMLFHSRKRLKKVLEKEGIYL